MSYGGKSGPSLLQVVIRDLADSYDDEERLAQREKLKADLDLAAERVDTLVKDHKDQLNGALVTFGSIDEKLRESQDKVRLVKSHLTVCKTLLRCKGDELKRLWLEDQKYKHMLKLLEKIEKVHEVPNLLVKHRESKHYLQATELLVNSVAQLCQEGELASIEGLRELKADLVKQKEELHHELIDELHRHLYRVTTSGQIQRPLVASVMPTQASNLGGKKATLQGSNQPLGKFPRSGSRAQMEVVNTVSPPPIKEQDENEVSTVDLDPQQGSAHYMGTLVEALSILFKVEDAVKAIQDRMEKELFLVVERAALAVTRQAEQELSTKLNQPKLLARLLQVCFDHFRNIVQAHRALLTHLHQTKRAFKGLYSIYQEADVWIAVQHVLQATLELYLDIGEESSVLDHTSFSHIDMKKKNKGSTKKHLFHFESSRHAMSVTSYMREQHDLELVKEGGAPSTEHMFQHDQPSITQHLVCKSSPKNIVVIFSLVRNFAIEVDEALKLSNNHCELYIFLHDYVDTNFLERIKNDYFDKLAMMVKSEAAKSVASDQKTLKSVGSKLSVLNSVIKVWAVVDELLQLTKDLPSYAQNFMDILLNLLRAYLDSCNAMYRELTTSIVEGPGGGAVQETVTSSKWAKDEDISRMIRSLSSWGKLQQTTKAKLIDGDDKHNHYSKESQLLVTNLGKEQLQQSSIVTNYEKLRLLAILHESLDWFSSKLKEVVPPPNTPQENPPAGTVPIVKVTTETENRYLMLREELSPVSLMDLLKFQVDFQTLSETAIVTLHLETRCHCFYYLHPLMAQTSYVPETSDIEPFVRQLCSDLKDIETVMVGALWTDKCRYLFDGLGHFIYTILLKSAFAIQHINKKGVNKMCRNLSALQECLSKIMLVREKDLDTARQYFELLLLNDEEVYKNIADQGPQFTLKEYENIFRLLRSLLPGFDEAKYYTMIRRLKQICSEDAV